MELCNDYDNFQVHAFLSRKVGALVNEINGHYGKSYATQHDIILKFVNERIFLGEGEFNMEFREKGKTYPDLKIVRKETDKGFEVVELRVHTSQLKYLRHELNKREKTYSNSDHLYFTYFLRVGSKEEGKVLKDKTCIYYLVIIKLSKNGIDEEKEELLGVENMIKVVDLERKVSLLEVDLEEKDKELNEKDKELNEKDKELNEKDKELERLKAQLKDK